MTVDTQSLAELRAALALGPTEGLIYDSNHRPFYNDAEGHSRGGDLDGTYSVVAPDFEIESETYEGPVLIERTSRANALYICAAKPSLIASLLDALERKDAETARLREVLEKVRLVIAADREALIACHGLDSEIPVTDELGRLGLYEYDGALHAIDSALSTQAEQREA